MHNRPYVIDVGLPSRTDSGAFTNDGRPLYVVKVRLLVKRQLCSFHYNFSLGDESRLTSAAVAYLYRIAATL